MAHSELTTSQPLSCGLPFMVEAEDVMSQYYDERYLAGYLWSAVLLIALAVNSR
jgi:hypothetical protein